MRCQQTCFDELEDPKQINWGNVGKGNFPQLLLPLENKDQDTEISKEHNWAKVEHLQTRRSSLPAYVFFNFCAALLWFILLRISTVTSTAFSSPYLSIILDTVSCRCGLSRWALGTGWQHSKTFRVRNHLNWMKSWSLKSSRVSKSRCGTNISDHWTDAGGET